MNYPGRMKSARLAHGLSLERLGGIVGHSKQYMHLIENGKIKLSYELAVDVANAMGTTTDEIFLNNPN